VRPAPVIPGSRYLALGDSVTFGYEEQAVVPAPDYSDASSFHGFPEQVASMLHLRVANAACPGETSSSLINRSAQSFGCENNVGGGKAYRKLYPLHVRYARSQLAYALAYLKAHRDVRLVSLLIGANDYFLCAATTSDGCAGAAEQQASASKITSNIRTILSAVRTKAHYGGQIVIGTYYALDYASPAAAAMAAALNKVVVDAARPYRVVVANGFAEFQQAARTFGGDPCGAGLLTQLGSPGKCGVHPSYAGQTLLAKAVADVIRL
jgi:lysophospholipase L1-like esterase